MGVSRSADDCGTDEESEPLLTRSLSPARRGPRTANRGRRRRREPRGEPTAPSRVFSRSLSLTRTKIPTVAASDKPGSSPVASLWSSTRREKAVFFCLFISNILTFMSLAIMAPFFPREAEIKGMSASVSGWVFGIFSLVQFTSAPLFGKLVPVLGSKFLLLTGSFFGGGCSILFGFLDKFPTSGGDLLFTLFSFVLRIALALGCTASSTATFAIATFTFPDAASTVLGFLETAIGLGLMLGPALGGFLYEAGGFVVPFAAVGAAMIIIVPVYCVILPSKQGTEEHGEPVSMLSLLRVPVITLIFITLIVTALLWVALDPTLEPHLRPLGLTPSQVGLVFLMVSGTYAIGAPISGRIADSMTNSTPLMIAGFAILTVGLLLLGPSPLLGLADDSMLWLDLVALFILGVGVSLAIVPTFSKVVTAAVEADIGESMALHGAVAGLWTSIYALGEFIGPVLGAAVTESLGFAWCMTIIAGMTLLMTLMTIFIFVYEKRQSSECCCRRNRKYSLLVPDDDVGTTSKV